MRNNLSKAIVAAIFGLTIMSGNAFAVDDKDRTLIFGTEAQTGTGVVNENEERTMIFNSETNVLGPNDSQFRTLDDVRDIYLQNGTLPGGTVELNTGINSTSGTGVTESDLLNNPEIMEHSDIDSVRTDTEAVNNTDSDVMNNLNQAPVHSMPNNLNTGVNTNIGTGSVGVDNFLSASECIQQLSTVNGMIVKNDAFFACQRYKW